MYLRRIVIRGYRLFPDLEMEMGEHLNILVGDNETGKSTILEAIHLVLTGRADNRSIFYTDINPFFFNAGTVYEYLKQLRSGAHLAPPEILIEAYIEGEAREVADFRGTHNSRQEDCAGLSLKVCLNEALADDFQRYIGESQQHAFMPVEYFRVEWLSFKGEPISARNLPFRSAMVDTSLLRSYSGPSRYVSDIIDRCLDESQRRALSTAYRRLKQSFSDLPGIADINKHLETMKGDITSKAITVSLDMSARSTWDSSITPHLDSIPLSDVGKGEQSSIEMKLAIGAASGVGLLLVEEPENHLSHTNMSRLVGDISEKSGGRQILITTHSSFVLNKLGINNVRLLSKSAGPMTLSALSKSTTDYFKKLPGHDTLRLLLAPKAILVEGPSDELVVQKAYCDKHKRHPLADGVDVISVRALAFKRFLEIARELDLAVCVVTDNDGKVAELETKYADYLGEGCANIKICYDPDERCPSLEDQLLKTNGREALDRVFETTYENDDALLKYMSDHKTDYALKLFETKEKLVFPDYIKRAIEA